MNAKLPYNFLIRGKYQCISIKITNIINEKVYIGQTTSDLNKRFMAHKNSLNFKHTERFPLARAIKKYGWKTSQQN